MYCVVPVPSEVPLHQEDTGRIGLLVQLEESMEVGNNTGDMETRHTSELKTLEGIGIKMEADGLYICLADNNRTTRNTNITINTTG